MPNNMMPYRGEHRSSVHSNGYSSDHQNQFSGEDAPTFVIEHLATFTVSKETGIVYPADGMRRLLQLEKANGIWSQKMQMKLDRSWVLIMDYETGVVMEKFPVPLIQEPTAFTSHDPMEIYNNILVFIVGPGQRQAPGRSEMHIFQCQSVSAQDLVEDLKLLRAGKLAVGTNSGGLNPRQIPPPPATPPPEPPLNGVNVREQVSVFNAASHHTEGRAPQHSEMGVPAMGVVGYPRDSTSVNDETSSTSSEKYERDVTILNHCFDDIEKFIARLQHASAASRELERRRRKSKKKDMGDGMLSMRAKPPPEPEFIDIFQKFKLSFNLLAKLKAHIHDPNAPELVHFLFTPLALIVDASHDTNYGPNLPAKVVPPLLTREAVNLLINCVTSKETELWHSLGDAWLIPRDQWKSYVPPYHPVFMDGWSPEHPVTDDRDHTAVALGSAVATEAKRTRGDEIRAAQHEAELREQQYQRERERDDSHYSSDYFDYDRQDLSPSDQNRFAFENRNYGSRHDRYNREDRERSQTPPSEREFPGRDVSSRSDISADSIEKNGGPGDQQLRFERAQHHWLDELRSHGAKIVQVTYPRTANNDKELTVIRGEYLEILDDSRKWWKARNSRGQIAHVPHTIVTPHAGADQTDIFHNQLYARGFDRHYPNQDIGHESHSPGHELTRPAARSPPIPPTAPAEWVRKERSGKKEVEDYDSDGSFDEDGLPVASTSRPRNEDKPAASPPPPPPPPPPPAPPAVSPGSTKSLEKNPNTPSRSRAPSGQDLIQEELRHVLTMYRERRKDIDIMKTPDVFIDQRSSAAEVQNWLVAKGFTERVCQPLKGMAGYELFALSRDQLEKVCGSSEGHRLFGQITIQKNVSGYKTARFSELKAILDRARKKVDDRDDDAVTGDSSPA
ncbi:epidermal growth factor receptor kinase substrate 8-like protein 1 isoform X2 [Ischnura elegans]|uniref:epidermal growth factor receptor kinase substrate 8-like protein 1 isoform X2 n=1 Tax=Ischnura elegans TaxID=197161 RepID=UPI001ED8BDAA|nr:epidermal growth factor receptor kinase substrate 8-like protein 1 isoform X2 [Ischnura elegans]